MSIITGHHDHNDDNHVLTCEEHLVVHSGHTHIHHRPGQEASSQAPGAGPWDQQLRGVQLGILAAIASSDQQHLSNNTIAVCTFKSYYNAHHVSAGHIAATPMVSPPCDEEWWQVLHPARPPVPRHSTLQYCIVQYSKVQYSTVLHPARPPVPGHGVGAEEAAPSHDNGVGGGVRDGACVPALYFF